MIVRLSAGMGVMETVMLMRRARWRYSLMGGIFGHHVAFMSTAQLDGGNPLEGQRSNQ